MTTARLILATLLFAFSRAAAAEYDVFNATISLPLVNSHVEGDSDLFTRTRLSNKQLINLVLGQPFKSKVPSNIVLAYLLPKGAAPFTGTIVVFNKTTKTVIANAAAVVSSNILAPDNPKKNAAALSRISFGPLANPEFSVGAFALDGSAAGVARPAAKGPAVTVKFSGLRGEFTRNAITPFYYAGVVLSASLRVSGKPIATVNI